MRLAAALLALIALVAARSDARKEGSFLLRPPAALPSKLHGQRLTSVNATQSASAPLFLNANTTKFAVNGSAIPLVDFDVGESYSGLMPISSDPKDPNQLFFWFFPSQNPNSTKQIMIWLNGGPGCSSFEGLFQENGPFLWQYGTLKPFPNRWSWTNLVHTVWVEQPIGTGFTQGTPNATSEEEIAEQFKGFWKNFVNTFGLHGYEIYISGESYAGLYCPYIASAMLSEKNPTYFKLSGMLIYDPVITKTEIQQLIPLKLFTDYWGGLFPFNDTFREEISKKDKKCGYTSFVNKYLTYPPPGQQPDKLPGTDGNGTTTDECGSILNDSFEAISWLNPCFDIYQVATTCPLLYDPLGFPGSFSYLPEGGEIYFARADVQAAIHAPNVTWEECANGVLTTDTSLPSNIHVLPKVIEATKNVIIANGALDMIIMSNGTLLGIQNMTWGGKLGFERKPEEPFYVPYHNEDPSLASIAASGVFGTTHSERGLTWVSVNLAGHMVPQYAPTAAYRQVEVLLGRVKSLSSTDPFTTDPEVPQSTSPLGKGTGQQGYACEEESKPAKGWSAKALKHRRRLM
ncbi:alpha/beta-hydrolase [Gonapodya prolifera JEL478]|uniref:Carboxypeptidase n=1 Tax=Gonapodya prolifera (strain JEL478) TaxID=1344416 RepID=A0A139AZE2_GONPJ|nr:alpha/beta-hydrolase [Gonapodya prolifera JEL478]|eukprot:KXS22118.1 alpha/beta-hydrolase [Gonapodya prolifera JEL478]